MDADSRRAVEVIRRGSNESIKEAISVLLGFDLEQALIDVLNDISSLCDDYNDCRTRWPSNRPGANNHCYGCELQEARRNEIQAILSRLDNLEAKQ